MHDTINGSDNDDDACMHDTINGNACMAMDGDNDHMIRMHDKINGNDDDAWQWMVITIT